jgi:hypothetical protein
VNGTNEQRYWEGIDRQCQEDAWQMFCRLMHHYIHRPEAWAKLCALGQPVSEGEKSVYAAEVKKAFMATLEE